jgi:hypothetical protein
MKNAVVSTVSALPSAGRTRSAAGFATCGATTWPWPASRPRRADRHRPGDRRRGAGQHQQTGEQGLNVARAIGLMAGLPVAAGGATVNRLCGSSLQALNQASMRSPPEPKTCRSSAGWSTCSICRWTHGLDLNPKLFQRTSKGALMMGVTAEFLAQTQGISREEQDAFALRSHQQAAAASQRRIQGARSCRSTPATKTGGGSWPTRDQCVRPDTSLEALAALEPAFMPKHRHGHRRQQLAAERRRRRAAGHVGGEGQGAGPQAAGPRPWPRLWRAWSRA